MQSSFVMNFLSSGVSSSANHRIFHHFFRGTPEWDAIGKIDWKVLGQGKSKAWALLLHNYPHTAKSKPFVRLRYVWNKSVKIPMLFH